ncbi:LysR family transcriptional regulator [Terrihabitans rhizophilus]|uniref:LysR family transcriptional regulator n=1 Tax=Terrihabitans rhizophilus TaxID=3092662 RepID=A0ABU4RTF5_9HYPH|nr:LysR family transcriptional regulator [Terrihabitans sp. PJ23]MDX6807438.1 LysR family transcriptional regulator [Terrihabitans sp. PJ23]
MVDRLQSMSVLVKAVDTGSLSAAARALGLTLPAASRKLAALEEHLGARLLTRTSRRLAPTEEGLIFCEKARQILAEVEEAEAALSLSRTEVSGRLSISAPTLIGRLRVSPLLPEFLASHPAVSIDLTLVDRYVNLAEEGLDLAIRVGELPDSDLIARRLGEVSRVVCATPDYLARRGTPETPDELAAHDCLVFADARDDAEWRFEQSGGTRRMPIPGRLRTNSLDAVVSAALGGAGIARVPGWQVAGYIAEGRLVRILEGFERPAVPIHAVYGHRRLLAPRVRAFVDFLVARWA